MSHVDRWRTHIPKPAFACAKAKVGILKIPSTKVLRERTDRVRDTRAGDIEAKADPTWECLQRGPR